MFQAKGIVATCLINLAPWLSSPKSLGWREGRATATIMDAAHMYSYDECLKHFNVKSDVGLTDSQVKDFQAKYGPNGE